MNDETPNNLIPLPLVANEGVTPEPAALTPGGDAPLFIDVAPESVPDPETQAALVALSATSPPPCEILETIDLGVLPWSKVPIREISSLVWFKYEKEVLPIPGPETFTVYNVVDGNGRILFCVNEEGMAHFFCCAANIYVHASLTNQV